jgi:hypothetical protein
MVNVTPFAYPGDSNQIKLNKNGTVLISMMAAALSRTNPYISSKGSVDHVSNIHESVVARECNPAARTEALKKKYMRSRLVDYALNFLCWQYSSYRNHR